MQTVKTIVRSILTTLGRTRSPCAAALLLLLPRDQAQPSAHPLAPPDRSSPRVALATFLVMGDTLGRFLTEDYLPSPTRAGYHRLLELADATLGSLDLGHVPPVARAKTGRAVAIALAAQPAIENLLGGLTDLSPVELDFAVTSEFTNFGPLRGAVAGAYEDTRFSFFNLNLNWQF